MTTPMTAPITAQAASSAILQRDGKLLLIRRLNPPSADLFAFPGGRAEPGELPAETALRELFEETGIVARNPVLFATYDLNGDRDDKRHFFLSVFRVEADAESQAIAADDAADPGWFTIDEIRRLPVPPSVLECAERIAADAGPGE